VAVNALDLGSGWVSRTSKPRDSSAVRPSKLASRDQSSCKAVWSDAALVIW